MIDLEKAVNTTDFYHCVIRHGFAFTSVIEPVNVLDAIIVRYPEACQAWTPKLTASNKTFQEHIDFINKYKLEKAVIIAENIDFIVKCPSLKYLRIIPADTAPEQFDYSPLYKMPEIKYLKCTTSYGGSEEPLCTSINCSNIRGIQMLELSGKGIFSYQNIESLERLAISNCRIGEFSDISSCKALKAIWFMQTGVESLQCIQEHQALQQLCLSYERRLRDVSAIRKVADSLRSLSIENCPKVTDFSFLMDLKNLEHLELKGSNELYDLSFLYVMNRLKTFTFSMKIKDGDLTPCLNVPYVWSARNRKEYNLKDKDLPKELSKEPFGIL